MRNKPSRGHSLWGEPARCRLPNLLTTVAIFLAHIRQEHGTAGAVHTAKAFWGGEGFVTIPRPKKQPPIPRSCPNSPTTPSNSHQRLPSTGLV